MLRKIQIVVSLAIALVAANASAVDPDDGLMGFVTVKGEGNLTLEGGLTGGAGGPVVTVTNCDDLVKYCNQEGPVVIVIEGTVQVTNDASKGTSHTSGSAKLPYSIFVKSDKTIIGKGKNATIKSGGFVIGKFDKGFDNSVTVPPEDAVHNIIIRNITFDLSGGPKSETDGISIFMHTHHVWVDHCTFKNYPDGALDIKRGSSYCTFSYNHVAGGNKAMLCGHADGNGAQDKGYLKVTYYKNYYDGNKQRTPRVRFGEVHCLNNYIRNCGDAMGAGTGSLTYAEKVYSTDDLAYNKGGKWQNVGCKGSNGSPSPSNVGWTPSQYYSYTDKVIDVGQVPSVVPANAGAGKIEPAIPQTAITPQTRVNSRTLTSKSIGNAAMFNPMGVKVSAGHIIADKEMAKGMFIYKTDNKVEAIVGLE